MKTTDQYHKWIEWSEDDQVYIGQCPDLIWGIHGDDPVKLFGELTATVEDVVDHLQSKGRPLPTPSIRPMREVV